MAFFNSNNANSRDEAEYMCKHMKSDSDISTLSSVYALSDTGVCPLPPANQHSSISYKSHEAENKHNSEECLVVIEAINF